MNVNPLQKFLLSIAQDIIQSTEEIFSSRIPPLKKETFHYQIHKCFNSCNFDTIYTTTNNLECICLINCSSALKNIQKITATLNQGGHLALIYTSQNGIRPLVTNFISAEIEISGGAKQRFHNLPTIENLQNLNRQDSSIALLAMELENAEIEYQNVSSLIQDCKESGIMFGIGETLSCNELEKNKIFSTKILNNLTKNKREKIFINYEIVTAVYKKTR